MRALIVADDLTGANDTGVQFAEAGWNTTLRIGPLASPAGDGHSPSRAVAVSTGARPLDDATARRLTAAAVAAEMLHPNDVVYVKVDSTMRGSVAGQLTGALDAWRQIHKDAFVVLAPAYPRMGRTVHGGLLRVHGRPVSTTSAGTDPVTPVTADGLPTLVPGSLTVPVHDTARSWADALVETAQHATVVAADACSDADLELLAEALRLIGPRALPAGSAGLAGPLAAGRLSGSAGPREAPPRLKRALVLVSSQHAVARSQVIALVDSATRQVRLVTTTVDGLLRHAPLEPDPAVGDAPVVLLSPDQRADASVANRLAAALAAHVADLVTRDVGFDGLVLVGGDGAEAVLRALHAHGLVIIGRLLEGVPYCRVADGPADGLPVITKAGGFGDDRTLLAVIDALSTGGAFAARNSNHAP